MTTWRWRRCPSCRQTWAAGDLDYADRPGPRWGWSDVAMRRCRRCGHEAPTDAFVIVREKHRPLPRRDRLVLVAPAAPVTWSQQSLFPRSTSTGYYRS